MLSIKDVVSLAKAGYKPADVKELIELQEGSLKRAKRNQKEEPKEKEGDYNKYKSCLEANRKAALTRDNSGSEPQQKSAEEIVNEALIGLLS